MLDWLLVVAPLAFSALVFGLALGTNPIDISLQTITTPSALEDRGYAADTMFELLELRKDERQMSVRGGRLTCERS